MFSVSSASERKGCMQHLFTVIFTFLSIPCPLFQTLHTFITSADLVTSTVIPEYLSQSISTTSTLQQIWQNVDVVVPKTATLKSGIYSILTGKPTDQKSLFLVS